MTKAAPPARNETAEIASDGSVSGPGAPPASANRPGSAITPGPAALPAEYLSTSATLATAGGFLDGFTYVGHGHVFANAMTGNVVLLGVEAVNGAWPLSSRHLTPILMFLLGIWAARALHLPVSRRLLPNPYAAVLCFECAILFVLMLLPRSTPDFWITASVAFASSMQVQTFRSVRGQTYNSTFTTGNLRMLSVGVFDWIFTTDKQAPRATAKIFAIVCGCFLAGAALGGFMVDRLGNRALCADLGLLLLALWRVVWPAEVTGVRV